MGSRLLGDDSTAGLSRAGDGGGLTLRIVGEAIFGSHPLPVSGRLVIGRGDGVDVKVVDPSISRHHAALHVGRELAIEDLGSANGTRIGERRLAPGEIAPIETGQVVEIGRVMVVVQPGGGGVRPRRLWPHGYFEVRLEEECARAARTGSAFSVVRLHVDGAERDTVERALAAAVRPYDVVAAYAPGEYEILLVDLGGAEAAAEAHAIAAKLAAIPAELRSGVASYPADGQTPEALVARACTEVEGAVVPASAPAVVAEDGVMAQLDALATRIAAGTLSVLLLGETGVGKEVMAERVHHRSPRGSGPFLRLNCAALSQTLLESELFGHEKGAFTGAVGAKPGLFETAHGGTVFLDEVGDLPLDLQAKLLRVLEDGQVWRVGAIKARTIDVRFLAATHRDLEADADAGRFRRDLYFRLAGITLWIPPLRQRVPEIAGLARAFVAQACRRAGRPDTPAIAPAAMAALERYVWPGNVRELRNVMERTVLLCSGRVIGPEHLPLEKMGATLRPPPEPPPPARAEPAAGMADLKREMAELERQTILDALARCGGNQTQAAKQLGISRGTLVARLDAFQVPRPRKR